MMNRSNILPGSTIGICAPSGAFDPDELENSVNVLKRYQYKVKIPEQIFDTERYFAGTDNLRAETFLQLINDPEVDAVMFARGGYGSMRLLDQMDFEAMVLQMKPVIGYSDGTALMSTLVQRCDAIVFHGPNLVDLTRSRTQTLDAFFKTIAGTVTSISFDNGTCLVPGTVKAKLVGGNLATLTHLLGTAYTPDFKDCILFIEDVNEPLYKIDRMLTQFKMAGRLEKIKGLVLGEFTDCGSTEGLHEIIMEVFGEYKIPIASGLPSGHGKVNLTLPLGTLGTLDSNHKNLAWK